MSGAEQYIDYYYADNAKALRKMVDDILHIFGDVPDKDNFYSIANEVFVGVLKSYDGKGHFQQYLKTCLTNKIKTEFTRRNRDKRMQYVRNKDGEKVRDDDGNFIRIPTISIDVCIQEDNENDSCTVSDFIQADVDIEDDSCKSDSRVQRYLDSLSDRQRNIAELFMDGYKPSEVREKLGLTKKEYRESFNLMSSYEKRRLLDDSEESKNDYTLKEENIMQVADNYEKTKNTSYSTESLSKKVRRHELRDDLVIQRDVDQWDTGTRGEFVSDILQGKSIPAIIISEERDGDKARNWIIDGKQRTTVIDNYLHDGFAVYKNVRRYMIPYQVMEKDKDGNDVLDDQGFQVMGTETFDIRGKKFSQLPEELQDKFKDYQVPVTLNLNCTMEEIAYDIARYNRGKSMNRAQVGWTEMKEEYAILIDELLKMDFFSADCVASDYKKAGKKTGALRRMVVEGFVAAYYIDSFNKNVGVMCRFMSETAKDSEILKFLQAIEELAKICTAETARLFNVRDSFLWFALYARFKETGLEPERFVNFLKEFQSSLCDVEIDGVSFNDLNDGGTKDKRVVVNKMTFLTNLLNGYLCNHGISERLSNDLKETDNNIADRVA